MTASAIGYLVKAGLLVRLGGDVEYPEVHPEQVAALGRRRDLAVLLDRHVPLGPDQAAARLGVRRADWRQVVKLGWVSPVATVKVDDGRAAGGVITVPLYAAEDVALLPVVRPGVDWRAVRSAGRCRRSPLAALEPAGPDEDTIPLAEAARMARAERAAVADWRRRHSDFPTPVCGTTTPLRFDRQAVADWLLAHGKIAVPAPVGAVVVLVREAAGAQRTVRLADPVLALTDDADQMDRLTGWMTESDVEALALLQGQDGMTLQLAASGRSTMAVPAKARLAVREPPRQGWAYVELAWPGSPRG
ncbi:hypothetical protein [Streptomyces bambusae]|uniref:Uncharacterized protein n=1 Tax=Streptomyces bambusae TaxID=1550616 RepID=A0ABS6Z380_9ACTN|nr:hypothetical protein [Streptomyces bambusae]MBW5481221.1 hypothetical protein [Streptomyces bambusae]